MAKWKPSEHNHKGVRYYEHPTRKHGIGPDKYYAIRYQKDGERREEGLGWASDGWTESKAALQLAQLKAAAVVGAADSRLADKRKKAAAERERLAAEEAHQQLISRPVDEYWEQVYLPAAQRDKAVKSWKAEVSLFTTWISPIIGTLPFEKVTEIHIEKIKHTMLAAGRSPRSVEYCLAVVRQIFNNARRTKRFTGPSPAQDIRRPKFDNRKTRFLSQEEATLLLAALRVRSERVYQQALLALHCGLRAGEIFSLRWGSVDLQNGILTLLDTKSGRNRMAYMTATVRTELEGMQRGEAGDLVFPTDAGQQGAISKTFERTVGELGLNSGVADRRQRLTFHSLRHSFASWHAAAGTDMFTLQHMMGHATPIMTQRYAHLSPETFRAAAQRLDAAMSEAPATTPLLKVVGQ